MTYGNTPPNQQPSYEVPPNQAGASQQQPSQQYYQQPQQTPPNAYTTQTIPIRESLGSIKKDKWVAFVLAYILGVFGVHKFYLGYKSQGITMAAITIIGAPLLGLGPAAMLICSIVEAVRYLVLSQEDFESTYVYGFTPWF
jgi:TM2 domain-containing membrane protein YozV